MFCIRCRFLKLRALGGQADRMPSLCIRLNSEFLDMMALVALEGAQIEAQSRGLDARQHHAGSAVRAGHTADSVGR